MEPGPAGAGPAKAAALELLVHGVGGTTPEDMLQDPHIVRVTGDATAGTYRRWGDRDAERRRPPGETGPVQEAYSWAHLTSGSASRAFWLLLLPFMVVNLVHWMRPARGVSGGRRARRGADAAYDLLVRLAALCLTVLLTAAACEVALDLTAWQCAGDAWCSAHKSWLDFMSAAHGGWWAQPGRRLAVGAALPAIVVAVLWFLSARTWAAYESQRPPRAAGAAGESPAGAPPMTQPGFWYGMRLVRRLRVVHVAAGLLTVSSALTVAALDHDRGPGGSAVLAGFGWALVGLQALLAAGVLALLARSRRSERTPDRDPDAPLVGALHWAALAVLPPAAVYAGWSRPGWVSSGRLPGAVGTMTVLASAQTVLVLALVVTALLLARGASGGATAAASAGVASAGAATAGVAEGPIVVPGPEHPLPAGGDEAFGGPDGPALRGLTGPVTAALAFGLGTLVSAAVAVWTADRLDRGATPGAPHGHIPGPPTVLTWNDTGLPVLLVLLAILIAVGAVRTARLSAALRPQVDAAYGRRPPGPGGAGAAGSASAASASASAASSASVSDQPLPASPERTAQIASAIARARLTDAGPVLIAVLGVLLQLLSLGAIAGAEAGGTIPSQAVAHAPTAVADIVTTAQSVGDWLVAATVVGLVALGRAAYKRVGIRRTVGVLWDVGTFWPRAAHPFAPPCYAERAVPDLVWRTGAWLAPGPERKLVISAHSQGTVLAAAAMWQLAPETRRRVALLTYGSPLRRLYGRYFPAYMGPEELGLLHADAPAWRNLFRVTDPIGGPVRLPAPRDGQEVDAPPFVDPLVYDRDLDGHPLPLPINAHSNYPDDPCFARERARVLGEV